MDAKKNEVSLNAIRAKLALIAVCVLCYGNTLFNMYSFDDEYAVTENQYVQKGIAGIPDILVNPAFRAGVVTADYRPLVTVSFAIENQIFGNNPHVSHMVNIILYVFLVLLIFKILNEVFHLGKLHFFLPFLITVFYAVHPSHTEVVASIKNRDEILSMLFALLSLLFSYRFFSACNKRILFAGLASFLMFLSLLSKQVSLTILVVMLLMSFFYDFHTKKKLFYSLALLLFLVSLCYVHISFSFLNRTTTFLENPLVGDTGISLRIGTIFQTLFFYFKFMLYPYPFRFYYGYDMIPQVTLAHPAAFASLLIHSAMLIYGVFLFKRKQILGFFILSYLTCILLYSNIIPYPGIVSERALFASSLWYIAAFILFLFHLGKFTKVKTSLSTFQKLLLTGSLIVVLAFSSLTIHRNFQWKDRLTLMSADIVHLKNSAHANFVYASVSVVESTKGNSAEFRKKYLSLAKKHYKRTLQLAPSSYYEAFFKLGMIYEYEEQNRDSAFLYFREGYRLDASHNPMKFQLAKQHYLRRNYSESERLFSSLYEALPGDTFTLYFYSIVLYELGKGEKAFKVNAELMKLAPGLFYPYVNFGSFYQDQGDMLRAVENFEKAVQLGCRYEEVYDYLLNYYLSTGQNEKQKQLMAVFNRQLRSGG